MKTELTPKEKAKELIGNFGSLESTTYHDGYPETTSIESIYLSKQCALIAVDEIIKHSPNKPVDEIDPIGYFMKVKQEIEKL